MKGEQIERCSVCGAPVVDSAGATVEQVLIIARNGQPMTFLHERCHTQTEKG